MSFSVPRILLLIAALLSLQWAGLTHAVSHHHHDQDEPPAACEWCGAYALAEHGLAGSPESVPRAVPATPVPVLSPAPALVLNLPRSRSRGPPHLV